MSRPQKAPVHRIDGAESLAKDPGRKPAKLGLELSLGEDKLDAAGVDEVAKQGIRLSFLMHDVSRMRRNSYDQIMKPLGITRAQWWALAQLSRHDGMMQTELADVLEVGKASLGDVLEGLEIKGWITRQLDPSDKRAKRVFLSSAAKALTKQMLKLEIDFNNRVFADLPHEERAALFESMSKVKLAIARLGYARW